MRTKELQEAYRAPKAKVVEMEVRSVLCQSETVPVPATFGGSNTEDLEEVDMSKSIWG